CRGASKCRSTISWRWNGHWLQSRQQHSSSNRSKVRVSPSQPTTIYVPPSSYAANTALCLSPLKFKPGLGGLDAYFLANTGASNRTWFCCPSRYQGARYPLVQC